MQFHSIVIAGLFLQAASAGAKDAPQATDAPTFVDEQGEEVFGLGYLPSPPEETSEPLLIGQPSAGFQVQSALRPMNQNAILKGAVPSGTGPDTLRGLSSRVPLLKSVRERFGVSPSSNATFSGAMPAAVPAPAQGTMKVHYVYVGQGAGAIVEFPCGVAVIDTGGEFGSSDNGGRMFVDYLEHFFVDRPALNRTIDMLITSHPHKDHLFGLSLMGFGPGPQSFRIRNIVDNGQSGTSGSLKAQSEARHSAIDAGANYSAVELRNQTFATGSTNKVIDPIGCPAIDPKITAFWGGRSEALNGGGSAQAKRYSTPNNHSVVVRIDFGRASFLFLGDLQQEGADDMLDEYSANPDVFDVDVYLSAHHGAENGTSDRLVAAMSPKIAIISMGDKSSTKPSTAFDHGHPRLSTIALMQDEPAIVSNTRTPVTFWGADAEETPFKAVKISRAIYGTGWEGSLIVTAKADGTYSVAKAQ